LIRKFTKLHLARDSAFVAPHRPLGGPFRRKSQVKDFVFTPKPGFLYVTARAISSRVNANYDGWPAAEIKKSYRTFIKRPVFVDHNNFDHRRTRGVIRDAKIHESVLANGAEDVWVELLIEVDAKTFKGLAKKILSGEIDAVSMGADVEYTICSVCGNKAHDVAQYCAHIPALKGRKVETWDKVAGVKRAVLCYEDCFGVNFFEISFVFDPADESADVLDHYIAPLTTSGHAQSVTSNGGSHAHQLPTMFETSSMARTAAVNMGDRQLMSLPQEVDTLRENVACPVCGAPMEENSLICENCGTEFPPPQLDDPNTAPAGLTLDTKDQAEGNSETGTKEPADADDPGDADDDRASKQKKQDAKDRKNPKGGKAVSKLDELKRQHTADAGTVLDQRTAPATSTAPYGTPAAPDGQVTPPPEPAVVSTDELRNSDANADVMNLDATDVVANPGSSEVTVPGDRSKKDDDSARGLGGGGGAAPPPATPSPAMARRKALLDQAEAHRLRAIALRREADEVVQTDVMDLDNNPATLEQAVTPEGRQDVTAPTQEPNQLGLADYSETIADGSETGLAIDPEVRRRGQPTPFNDVAPYGQPAAVASKTASDLFKIADFVEKRIELGLDSGTKLAERTRFERMSNEKLAGFMEATLEFEKVREQQGGRRVSVRAAAGRVPPISPQPKTAAVEGGETQSAEDTLLFVH
jgi:hypothetical protein